MSRPGVGYPQGPPFGPREAAFGGASRNPRARGNAPRRRFETDGYYGKPAKRA
jgi:hypothetical protein